MARARNIKPGFFENEDLSELVIEARLLFIGLWTLADREGRLEDRPKRIKAQLFPFDGFDVETLLCALAGKKFIIRYAADGERYIAVPKWLKHQKPHPRENASVIPPPESNDQKPYLGTAEPDLGMTQPDLGLARPGLFSAPSSSLNPSCLNVESPLPLSASARVTEIRASDASDTPRKPPVSGVTVSLPAWMLDEEYRQFVDLYQASGKPVIDEDFTEAYRTWTALSFEQRVDRIRILRRNIESGCYPDPQFMPSPKRFLVSEHKRKLQAPRSPPSKADRTAELFAARLAEQFGEGKLQ